MPAMPRTQNVPLPVGKGIHLRVLHPQVNPKNLLEVQEELFSHGIEIHLTPQLGRQRGDPATAKSARINLIEVAEVGIYIQCEAGGGNPLPNVTPHRANLTEMSPTIASKPQPRRIFARYAWHPKRSACPTGRIQQMRHILFRA